MSAAGENVGMAEVEAALRMASHPKFQEGFEGPSIKTRRRRVAPRSPLQAYYINAMTDCELVFGLGPAGTGKTYLAVCFAVECLLRGEVKRIILSRPAVEAGEHLGFLPGDMRDKVDPYLRPIYDALHDTMSSDQIVKRLENGEIEIAPLAFMRGRTLSDAFVILDEAQNTSPVQMKMFLTRLGENSRMVITGDLSQIDLPSRLPSGLADAVDTLKYFDQAKFVKFTEADVVRHPLVAGIVRAYAKRRSKLTMKSKMTKDLVVDINIRGMTPNDLSEPVKVAISKAACRAWSCAGQALNNAEISLLITDDWQIRKLNKRYRGIDCPTNVLSFACSCDATSQVDGAPVLLGDIVLGYGVIAREAKLHKKAFSDHICHLVVHGSCTWPDMTTKV